MPVRAPGPSAPARCRGRPARPGAGRRPRAARRRPRGRRRCASTMATACLGRHPAVAGEVGQQQHVGREPVAAEVAALEGLGRATAVGQGLGDRPALDRAADVVDAVGADEQQRVGVGRSRRPAPGWRAGRRAAPSGRCAARRRWQRNHRRRRPIRSARPPARGGGRRGSARRGVRAAAAGRWGGRRRTARSPATVPGARPAASRVAGAPCRASGRSARRPRRSSGRSSRDDQPRLDQVARRVEAQVPGRDDVAGQQPLQTRRVGHRVHGHAAGAGGQPCRRRALASRWSRRRTMVSRSATRPGRAGPAGPTGRGPLRAASAGLQPVGDVGRVERVESFRGAWRDELGVELVAVAGRCRAGSEPRASSSSASRRSASATSSSATAKRVQLWTPSVRWTVTPPSAVAEWR